MPLPYFLEDNQQSNISGRSPDLLPYNSAFPFICYRSYLTVAQYTIAVFGEYSSGPAQDSHLFPF